MEEFTYTNIFDTKGIEYLIIITFLLLIVPFWRLLNKPVKAKAMQTLGYISENVLRIPRGLFYSKHHSWTHLEKSGFAKIGLDDLLANITGNISITPVVESGDMINKGDLIAHINQNGKELKITSPISGKIESYNKTLFENPSILHEDPYEKGWIAQIKPEDWQMETSSYLLAEDAAEWAKNELARVKDFIAVSLNKISPEPSMVILQDGGEITKDPLSQMPKEVWDDFQKEFLD